MEKICNECKFCEPDAECPEGYLCDCQHSEHYEDCVSPSDEGCEAWESR